MSTAPFSVGKLIAHATVLLAAGLFAVTSLRTLNTNLGISVFSAIAALFFLITGHFSWRSSRRAWAFMFVGLGVSAVLALFSAPAIAAFAKMNVWVGMVPALLLGVGCVLAAFCAPPLHSETTAGQ